MTESQRRRWERYRKELDAKVRTDAFPSGIPCTTLDVCERGFGIVCPQMLEVGKDYGFEIPDLADSPLVGTVRWCTPAPSRNANHVGVELTGITAQQIEAVRSAIERWKAADVGLTDD
jgi:hypothetical protein